MAVTAPTAARTVNRAVVERRFDAGDRVQLFPTPLWATRALVQELARRGLSNPMQPAWEPACGRGHMVRALREYFTSVYASDAFAHVHGFGSSLDFTVTGPTIGGLMNETGQPIDWIITNPPFPLAADFARIGYEGAAVGCALLTRTSFLEGKDRHRTLFAPLPPAYVFQFTERVPMTKDRCDRHHMVNGKRKKVTTATSYAWIVWLKPVHNPSPGRTTFAWIAPCRERLERFGDYDDDGGGTADDPATVRRLSPASS